MPIKKCERCNTLHIVVEEEFYNIIEELMKKDSFSFNFTVSDTGKLRENYYRTHCILNRYKDDNLITYLETTSKWLPEKYQTELRKRTLMDYEDDFYATYICDEYTEYTTTFYISLTEEYKKLKKEGLFPEISIASVVGVDPDYPSAYCNICGSIICNEWIHGKEKPLFKEWFHNFTGDAPFDSSFLNITLNLFKTLNPQEDKKEQNEVRELQRKNDKRISLFNCYIYEMYGTPLGNKKSQKVMQRMPLLSDFKFASIDSEYKPIKVLREAKQFKGEGIHISTEVSKSEFLKYIIEINKDIEIMTDIYEALWNEHQKIITALSREKYKVIEGLVGKVEKLAIEYQTLESKYPILEKASINIEKSGLLKPIAPVRPAKITQSAPTQPIEEKSNIFNKKKVEERNKNLWVAYYKEKEKYDELIDGYNKKMQAYNENYKKYENEMKIYQQKELEFYENENARIARENQKRQNYLEKTRIELEEKSWIIEAEIYAVERFDSSKIDQIYGYEGYAKVRDQLDEAKEKLTALIQIREQLYNSGYIYEKYCSIVPITTMYGYFESGRCTEFIGAEGAYNMFEREVIANRIEEKLDNILSSLEAIKKNQYETYKYLISVKESSSILTNLIAKFGSDLISIMNKSQNIFGEIERNTSFVAYQTEMTAYYAKVNAEIAAAPRLIIG